MGSLPSFAKPIGLDLIVRPGGEVALIELQHHFGRSGLLRLFPAAAAQYRKTARRLRLHYGVSEPILKTLRKICTSKIKTYRTLSSYQPRSYVYQRWSPSVKSWLETLESSFILAKPSRGSCGRGIMVFERRLFNPSSIPTPLSAPLLLQEYLESRALPDDGGRPHVGCIRHIVALYSNGQRLGFVHFPPYWRVSPTPFRDRPVREAFTANISTGAYPVPVDETDSRSVFAAAESIACELVESIVGCDVPRGRSEAVSANGRSGAFGTVSPVPGHADDQARLTIPCPSGK